MPHPTPLRLVPTPPPRSDLEVLRAVTSLLAGLISDSRHYTADELTNGAIVLLYGLPTGEQRAVLDRMNPQRRRDFERRLAALAACRPGRRSRPRRELSTARRCCGRRDDRRAQSSTPLPTPGGSA